METLTYNSGEDNRDILYANDVYKCIGKMVIYSINP